MLKFRLVALALLAGLLCLPAWAQTDKPFEPQVGQSGKDVIWVPTPEGLVERMLKMAGVTAKDIVFDLGSGDGRTVIAAAKLGARATGIEYDPNMVELSSRNAEKAGVSARARFIKADIFEFDFTSATVVTLYLLTDLNIKLRPILLGMKPGTRVVSHQFRMGEWEPDRTVNFEDRPAYLWVVPAKVAGTWKLKQGNEEMTLVLTQTFQKLDGTAKSASGDSRLASARMRAETITFSMLSDKGAERRFTGTVTGDAMSGSGSGGNWTAQRIGG